MPKRFTESEKEHIRTALIAACKKSWSIHGYRKTVVGELCASVGISTGAFYLFYDSKEALFCDVMDDFQQSTKRMYDQMLSKPPTKDEIRQVLKQLYLEYAANEIITKRHTPDYKSLLNKLPQAWKDKHAANSESIMAKTLFAPKLKMGHERAHGIIDTLLLTVANKHTIPDHYEIFCTLLDCVIGEIYE